MFKVKDFMTKDVICTEADAKITAIVDVMKKNNIHRVPVTDADGKLVGLITEGMIASNQSATSLSIYELNYLLSKTKVKTVMCKKPVSISEDAFMEEATETMLKHDIACLPVVDEKGIVKGILTQNDVFKSYLEILGWNKEGARIALDCEDKIGQLENIAKIFADAGVNIGNIGVYEKKDGRASMIIRTGKAGPEILEKLKEAGYTNLQMESN